MGGMRCRDVVRCDVSRSMGQMTHDTLNITQCTAEGRPGQVYTAQHSRAREQLDKVTTCKATLSTEHPAGQDKLLRSSHSQTAGWRGGGQASVSWTDMGLICTSHYCHDIMSSKVQINQKGKC